MCVLNECRSAIEEIFEEVSQDVNDSLVQGERGDLVRNVTRSVRLGT